VLSILPSWGVIMVIKKVVFSIFLAASFAASSSAGTICRLDYLDGYKPAKARALSVIKNRKTSAVRNLEVYVEMTDEGAYFHSNFLSEGADHVTKIGGFPELNSLELAIQNMIFSDHSVDPLEASETMEKAMRGVKVYLDRSIFNDDGTTKIELDGAKNLFVLTDNVAVEVEKQSLGWRDIFISKVAGCCFFGIPPYNAAKLKEFLQGKKLNQNKIKFASMINDTATDDAITNSKLVAKARDKGTFFGFFKSKFESSDDLLAMIKKNRNGTLVLLGHHESGNFVRRSPDGTKEFSINLKDAHQLAKENNVLLIALGCSTAEEVIGGKRGIGTLSNINTVDMVKKIENGLVSSNTYADFFENISDTNNMMVASIDTVEGWAEITVYDKPSFELNPKEVGVFFILGLDRSSISIPNDDRCVNKTEKKYTKKYCRNSYESFVANRVINIDTLDSAPSPWE